MGEIAGTTFAGYQVGDVIARDLVSTVYRADAVDGDERVALRVVAQDLCVDEGPDHELYRRFQRQAIAMLTVDDPALGRVEEVGEFRGRGYLVAAHRASTSLTGFVGAHGATPVGMVVSLLRPIAAALDGLHADGVAHGALNPATVRIADVDRDGRPGVVFLTGHGIGALLEQRLRRDRKELAVVDELQYVAPEQLRRRDVTGRTDQYALACAVVHLTTGSPPFRHDTIGGLFGAHLFVEPQLPADDAWRGPIARGMAKAPDDRHDSCTALLAAVEDAVARRADAPRSPRTAAADATDVTREADAADDVSTPTLVAGAEPTAARWEVPSWGPPQRNGPARGAPADDERRYDTDRGGVDGRSRRTDRGEPDRPVEPSVASPAAAEPHAVDGAASDAARAGPADTLVPEPEARDDRPTRPRQEAGDARPRPTARTSRDDRPLGAPGRPAAPPHPPPTRQQPDPDVPLLSDVLSQRPERPVGARIRVLLLVLLAVLVGAAAVWTTLILV